MASVSDDAARLSVAEAPQPSPSGEAPAALTRGVGPLGLAALTVNCVVGAGILGLPGHVYALAGAGTMAVVLASALLAIAVALCLAELASRFEGSGGPVEYLDAAFGRWAGFLAGWTVWTATVLSAASLLNLLASLVGPDHRALVIIIAVLALSGATMVGVRQSTAVSSMLTLLKVAVLTGIAVAGLSTSPHPALPVASAPRPFAAIVLLFFAFVGFERPTLIAGEVRDARRSVPLALVAGMLIVAALYVALFAACLRGLPALAASERPLNEIAVRLFGEVGARAFAWAGAAIVLGTLMSQWITAPRLLLALAERGELPSLLARVSHRRRTPDPAILATAMAALVFALGGSFVGSLAASSASRLLVFLGCAAAMIRLRGTGRAPPRFRLPAGAIIAAAVIAACAGLLAAAAEELARMLATLSIGVVLWLLTVRTKAWRART